MSSILATVLVEESDSTKIWASAGVQAAQTISRNASKSSSGVQYPRFFLGRLLRASAAQRIAIRIPGKTSEAVIDQDSLRETIFDLFYETVSNG